MGGTHSKQSIQNIVNNNMLVKADLTSITESMTNVDTELNNQLQQSAVSMTELKNLYNFKNVNITADGGTVNIEQSNDAKVYVSIEQTAKIVNSLSENITNEINQAITEAIDMEAVTSLINKAKSDETNGAVNVNKAIDSVAGKDTDIEIKNEVNTNMEVSTSQRLENYINNVVKTVIANHLDQYCGTNFKSLNEITFDGSNINAINNGVLNLKQTNKLDLTDECKQNSEINNEIIIQLCSGVGVEIDDSIKLTSSTEATNENERKEVNQSLVDEAFNGVANVATSVTSGLYSILAVVGVVICIVVIVVIGGLAFVMTDETGSKTLGNLANTAADVASKANPAGAAASILKGGCYNSFKFSDWVNKI